MKKILFLEIVRRLKSMPNFKKRFKIFALVGIGGLLITTSLIIWAAISAIRFVGNQIQTTQLEPKIEKIESHWASLPTLNATNCWFKAQTLLNFQSWLSKPVIENMVGLKNACLNSPVLNCEKGNCPQLNQQQNGSENQELI